MFEFLNGDTNRPTGTTDVLAESQPVSRQPASRFRGFDLGVGFG